MKDEARRLGAGLPPWPPNLHLRVGHRARPAADAAARHADAAGPKTWDRPRAPLARTKVNDAGSTRPWLGARSATGTSKAVDGNAHSKFGPSCKHSLVLGGAHQIATDAVALQVSIEADDVVHVVLRQVSTSPRALHDVVGPDRPELGRSLVGGLLQSTAEWRWTRAPGSNCMAQASSGSARHEAPCPSELSNEVARGVPRPRRRRLPRRRLYRRCLGASARSAKSSSLGAKNRGSRPIELRRRTAVALYAARSRRRPFCRRRRGRTAPRTAARVAALRRARATARASCSVRSSARRRSCSPRET